VVISAALLVCILLIAASDAMPAALTLEEIFSKASAVRYLSYQTKVTSPAGSVRTYRIWIHEDDVYVSGRFEKIKQVGKKSYVLYNDGWLESPGLTVITLLQFLKQARAADDTKIVGQQTYDGIPNTIIEFTQPRRWAWGSEIKIKLWISHEHFMPVRVREQNITQNKIQTEEITHISFNRKDHEVFLRETERLIEVRRKARERLKSWTPEHDAAYQKMLQLDKQEDLTAGQKMKAWEDFLKTISKQDPTTSRDDQVRFKCRKRIDYWKYVSRFIYHPNGIVKDTETGLEWISGPDKDINWEEAESWAKSLTIGGGGWRLPTIDELQTLYKKGIGKRNLPPYLKTAEKFGFVWSGERRSKAGSWCFEYVYGKKTAYGIKYSKNFRAFAVRK